MQLVDKGILFVLSFLPSPLRSKRLTKIGWGLTHLERVCALMSLNSGRRIEISVAAKNTTMTSLGRSSVIGFNSCTQLIIKYKVSS